MNFDSVCLLDYLEGVTEHLSSTLLHSTHRLWPLCGKEHLSHYLLGDLLERSGAATSSWLKLFAKKGSGAVRREKLLLQGDCGQVKLWNLTFTNILSPLDLIQSFSLGRSCPNLSTLGSPFSDPMKSGATGERDLAIIEQLIPAAG